MDSNILFFFGEHTEALPIYERLENAILTRIPDVKIKVAKTQITFAGKRGFAFVSFNPCRRAKDCLAVWMTVTFGLGYQKESPQNRWRHGTLPRQMDASCAGGKCR